MPSYDIIFQSTSILGDADPGISTFKLYGTPERMQTATSCGLLYFTWAVTSHSGWRYIPRAGYAGAAATYMGNKSDSYKIGGAIYSSAGSLLPMLDTKTELIRQNSGYGVWNVSMTQDGITFHSFGESGHNYVIDQIVMLEAGEGTGPFWPFMIEFTDLDG